MLHSANEVAADSSGGGCRHNPVPFAVRLLRLFAPERLSRSSKERDNKN